MKVIKKLLKPLLTHPQVATRLCRLFLGLDNKLDEFVNELLPYTESGVHPKHRLMNYHQFFLDNVSASDRVLDVGCGQGIVANDIAAKAKAVVGIDFNAKNIDIARRRYSRPNLSFVLGDALKDVPSGEFDVIVLSNVLEHIEQRVAFLRGLKKLAPKILIRVPMITRDWKVLYKKGIGLDYRMDKTHFIEYTEEEFVRELTAAGFQAVSTTIRFGELWVVAAPVGQASLVGS